MKKKINIIFAGNNKFSINHLKYLLKCKEFNIKYIITKKKKKIKKILNKKKIKIFETKTIEELKNIKNKIKKNNIDIGILISYGYKIPESIINIPKNGFINIHASLLPRWRGSSPIQNSILSGDKKTGVTFIKINKYIDQGKIIYQKKCKIKNHDNYLSLLNRIQIISIRLIKKIIINFYFKKYIYKKQNKKYITYAKKIKKKDGLIKWKKNNAITIYKKIKAFFLWPKTYFYHKKKIIFIWSIKIINKKKKDKPGKILTYNKKKLIINTITYPIEIKKIQINNKKILNIIDFINSKKNFFKKGEILK